MNSAQKGSTKRIAGVLDDACENDYILVLPCLHHPYLVQCRLHKSFMPPLLHAPLVQYVNIPLMYAPVHDAENSFVASPINTSAGASPINNSAWISPTTTTGTPASPTEISARANVSGAWGLSTNTSFVKGNISRCYGCGNRDLRRSDGKPHSPQMIYVFNTRNV